MQHATKMTKRILHPHGLALAGESNTYAPATRAVTPSRRILARKGTQAGGNAPHGPHEAQHLFAAPAVHQNAGRHHQRGYGNIDDGDQTADLSVGQAPFGFDVREKGGQNLPVYQIEKNQQKGDGESDPGGGPVSPSAAACPAAASGLWSCLPLISEAKHERSAHSLFPRRP